MIYISCTEEDFENIIDILSSDDVPCIFTDFSCPNIDGYCQKYGSECMKRNIKRINTDITPDKPNYKTEAENKAFLQGFNVAVNKMRGEVEE